MPSDGLQGANAANSGKGRSFGCRRIPGCGAFPSRRSVSNVSRFARNTPLHTKKFFLFYLRFFKPPYRGGKKKKIFFVLGVRGGSEFRKGQCFTTSLPCNERGRGGGDSPLQRDDGRTRGKTPLQNGFLLFSLKAVARAFRGRGGASEKDHPPQRLERDRLQPLTATRSCNPRERKKTSMANCDSWKKFCIFAVP